MGPPIRKALLAVYISALGLPLALELMRLILVNVFPHGMDYPFSEWVDTLVNLIWLTCLVVGTTVGALFPLRPRNRVICAVIVPIVLFMEVLALAIIGFFFDPNWFSDLRASLAWGQTVA